MKILQLIQKPQLRGAEIFASQLSNHLLEQGHEVMMVCLLEGSAVLPFKGKIIYLNRPLASRLFDVKGWKQLARLIREFKPDILQANAGDTLKFAVLSKLCWGWKAPIIFRNANKVSDFIDSAAKKIVNRFLVSRVDKVISVSELCREDITQVYALEKDKAVTVPIGIEFNAPDTSLPADLQSFFSDSPVLLHVASFVKEKNHEGLVRIVSKLVTDGMNVKLVMVGDGRLRQEVSRLIHELNLEDRIRILGYRTDVGSIMCNAHAFVLPSKIEGLPGVILEAMFCRLPVVAYDVGGIAEVVKPNQTGYLVKAGDEAAFGDSIKLALLGNNEEIIERANQQVREQFDNRIIAQRFLSVYQQVAG